MRVRVRVCVAGLINVTLREVWHAAAVASLRLSLGSGGILALGPHYRFAPAGPSREPLERPALKEAKDKSMGPGMDAQGSSGEVEYDQSC